MNSWFQEIWKTYAEKKQRELGFNRSLMVFDSFSAHKTDDMKALLSTNNTNTGFIILPGGCTFEMPAIRCFYKQAF